MSYELEFNLARSSAFRKATFESADEKSEYVRSEFSDLECQNAWLALQACYEPEGRKDLERAVDTARYNFYLKWVKERKRDIPSNVVNIAEYEDML